MLRIPDSLAYIAGATLGAGLMFTFLLGCGYVGGLFDDGHPAATIMVFLMAIAAVIVAVWQQQREDLAKLERHKKWE